MIENGLFIMQPKKKSLCDQDHKIGIGFGTLSNWEFGNGTILQLI